MNKLIVLGLLCGLAACMTFKWEKTDYDSVGLKVTHVTHQSSADGMMHMLFEDFSGTSRIMYRTLSYSGSSSSRTILTEKNSSRGYNTLSLQVSDSGKHLIAGYFGCQNKPLLNLLGRPPSDCANLYFIESVDGGYKWTEPVQVSKEGVYIPAESSLSVVLEKDTERVFIFHSIRTEEDDEFSSRIVVYSREPGETEFKLITTTKPFVKLMSLSATVTKNYNDGTRYVHLVLNTNDTVFYSSSKDHGKTWNYFTSIARGTLPNYFNFVASDIGAYSNGFFVQYRDSAKKSYVIATFDHGKTFGKPILVGDSPRNAQDAVGLCGSEELEEAMVVSSHIDYDPEKGFVRVLFEEATTFVDLPYPFPKPQGTPMTNLMIDCAQRGTREYYITFYMLSRGDRDRVYYAFGTLKL